MLIDGKQLSEKIYHEISTEHDILKEKYQQQAGLAVIIVGNNSASKIYVKNKILACKKVGFHSSLIEFPDTVSEQELLCCIHKLNQDNAIHGILVQLPLPKHINETHIIQNISINKDVDGFHPENIGKLLIGDPSGFLPCTPFGILQMIEEYQIEISGKDVVVVGRSNIVGKPIALLLLQKGATVQICHSKTKELHQKLKRADIIVAAAGVPNLISGKDVKEGVIIFDVGINRYENKLCGDVLFDEIKSKAKYITPVPGGVGPMTVASLIKNTFISYKTMNNKKKEVVK